MALFDRLADRSLVVEDVELSDCVAETSSNFVRRTTVVSLHGDGHVGRGEDVTYEADAHERLQTDPPPLDFGGKYTFGGFVGGLDDSALFTEAVPDATATRNYRRWAFESAALDLALRQAGTDLGTALDREPRPPEFVVSTRLGDPPSADRVHRWLEIDPELTFKLDPTQGWTRDLVEELAATGAVRTVDLKGQYEGTEVDQPADPALYRLVVEGFPEAIVEDPAVTPETEQPLSAVADRVSWDYPVTGPATLDDLPIEPAWINVKPSRLGSVESLLETVERCEERGIGLYGGGQFELDVGRAQIQTLASIFYPSAANDVAPRGYNEPTPRRNLPRSPLDLTPDPVGFGG